MGLEHKIEEVFFFRFLLVFSKDNSEQLDLVGLESRHRNVLKERPEIIILHNLVKE